MSWVATAVAGSAIVGGAISANASEDAADAQTASANEANKLTAGQFNKTQSNLSPWLASGTSANDYLSRLLGIPGYESGGRIINGQQYNDINQVKDIWRNDFRQKAGGIEPTPEVEAQIDAGVRQAWAMAKPVEGASGGDFGILTKPFGMEDFKESPAYQFNLEQGRKAIDKSAAARGRYYAPSTLQDIAKFSQGLASNEFQNAFSNYRSSLGDIYSRLHNASGAGQNAAANIGGFGAQAAGSMGNNLMGAGNAAASGIVGQANALTGGIGNAYNNYVLSQMLQRNQAGTYSSPQTGDVGDFYNNLGVFA